MRHNKYHEGMTLVEMMVASALIGVMAIGLIAIGLKSQAIGEHSRTATEARCLARERMEEIISFGLEALRTQAAAMTAVDTNYSNRGFPIIRKPSLIWHLPDGSVTSATTGTYAEVHLDVEFWSPLFKKMVTNDYAMIIEQ